MNAAVLLVDDDRALRKLVRAYLHEEGIGVLESGQRQRGRQRDTGPAAASARAARLRTSAAGGVGDATHDSQPEPAAAMARSPSARAPSKAKLGDAEHSAHGARAYSEPTAR